ncbi:MAG: UDP-N-acetylglucosamine 2-epimerase (non-hydrolyzing) [Pseudobdellovibrio sp.]
MNKKTVIFVFGTRPELIKIFPLILEAKKNSHLNVLACSTGQHKEMLDSLYEVFNIKPDIDFQLMKPNQNLTQLHAETMMCIQKVIHEHKPDWLVVQGDTTTAHASAMAAFYERVPVAHVEAGLRTYDINSPYPEEMNRRAIGLIAKAHLSPTLDAANNLKAEGVDASAVLEITGNTGIDTLKIISQKVESSESIKASMISKFKYVNLEKFVLATMHRRENFGVPQRQILNSFLHIAKTHQIDILFPVHPNPNVRISVEQIYNSHMSSGDVVWVTPNYKFDNSQPAGRVFLVEPLHYQEMVFILQRTKLVMTDSGGLQEEAPTFAKKILVLRNSTERPEAIEAGFSELVGTDFDKITTTAAKWLNMDNHWPNGVPENPFGDGKASERIIRLLSLS